MKREDGWYHIKRNDGWCIAESVDGEWYLPTFSFGIFELQVLEVDERRIVRPEPEASV